MRFTIVALCVVLAFSASDAQSAWQPSAGHTQMPLRVRAGRIFMTLGNRESDIGVADIEGKSQSVPII